MGLNEKRAIKAFQENTFPKLVKKINEAAGFPVELDVQWDTLAVADNAHLYDEGFTKVYFTPVINAFKDITTDDLGKDGLKETLKKVVIKNEGGYYSPGSAISFEGGVLTIDHEPVSNINDIDQRANAIANLLAAKM
ncbi:MAG TPA: hypothetical protein PKV73_08695 [Agriterribacter sp.]|nr:hypothetical protein [Chitinophagaceae bacterium]HRP31956.1 hypothetical protein [Agriterribacter sp.]